MNTALIDGRVRPGALAVALSIIALSFARAVGDGELDEGIRGLGDGSFARREEATAFLWRHGEAALSRLEAAAGGDDPEVVMRARSLLARVRMGLEPGASAAVVGFAEKCLPADEDGRRALLASAPDEPEILRMLPRLFKGGDDVKTERVRFIQKLGQGSHPDALIPMLADTEENDDVRGLVADILGRRGCDGAIPHLVAILGEDRIRYRNLALSSKNALTAMGRKGVDALCEGIVSTQDPVHRQNLIWALMREDAAAAIPVLTDCLKDQDAVVRQHAISALQQVEGASAAPKLLPFLDDPGAGGGALLALEKLAGRSFDNDAAACRTWWEARMAAPAGNPDTAPNPE